MLSPVDWTYAWRARKAGVPRGVPSQIIAKAKQTGVPYSLAFALIEIETGFHNCYGHDRVRNPIRSPDGGLLMVTHGNYVAYLRHRHNGEGNQGVGWAQLTSPGLQDEADRLGGCWKTGPNLYVGFKFLAALRRQFGAAGAWRYNGAPSYQAKLDAARGRWHRVLTRTAPAGLGIPSWVPEKWRIHWQQPWTAGAARSRGFHKLLWAHGLVSPHFTKSEWACHDQAKTRPPDKLRGNAQRHGFALERFRHALGGVPIPLGSAYRTEAYNRQVHGAKNSRHVQGDATDLFKAWVDHVGRGKALVAADRVWRNGGVGNETSGTLHVDSRGFRARFVTWTRT